MLGAGQVRVNRAGCLDRCAGGPVAVVYPEVGGARGNPVVFGAPVRDAILAGGPDFGCRQWQAGHPEAVMAFATDNPHYRLDIDTPEDLARFTRETGRALRWPEGSA